MNGSSGWEQDGDQYTQVEYINTSAELYSLEWWEHRNDIFAAVKFLHEQSDYGTGDPADPQHRANAALYLREKLENWKLGASYVTFAGLMRAKFEDAVYALIEATLKEYEAIDLSEGKLWE